MVIYARTVVLRCTQRVLALLGVRLGALADPPPSDDDWYLNLLWLERRKCLLFTHAGTLFSVFVADVRAADIRPIGPYAVAVIEPNLRSERLPRDALGPLDPTKVQLAKTASRSVLGFMNDIVVHCRYQIAADGSLDNCDIDLLNHRLRRTLHNRGGYVTPIELVAERLADPPTRS